MKNVLKGIFAVALMALVGCSQDEQMVVMNDTNEAYTGVMEVAESRTFLGENGKVVWSDEDAVSIFKKSGYHQKYQVEKGGSTVATLEYANVSQAHDADLNMNYAVYPYVSTHSIDDDATITLDLKSLASQKYTEGSFENGQSVMVAKSDNTNLAFFNTLAMLRVKLCSKVPGDYSVNSITLASTTNSLSGSATVDMSKDKQPAVFEEADGSNQSIELKFDSPVKLEKACVYDGINGIYTGGHDFYILVPVVTFAAEDLTIKIEGVDNYGNPIVYEEPYPEELVLERSEITTIHHEFGGEGFTAMIEPEFVGNAEDLYELAKTATGDVVIMLADNITLGNETEKCPAVEFKNATSLTIYGNKKVLTLNGKSPSQETSDGNVAGVLANNANVTIKDLTIVNKKLSNKGTETSAARNTVYTFVRGATVTYENVTFDGGVQVKGNETFKGCSFTEDVLTTNSEGYATNGRFCMFIDHQYDATGTFVVTLEDCVFNASGYGCIKVAGDKGANITVNVKGCSFTNTCPRNDADTPKYDIKKTGANITVNDQGGNDWSDDGNGGYGEG